MHDEGLKACCGARFLALFGNCRDWRGTPIGNRWKGPSGKAALKKELESKIKMWDGQAFLVAILNNEQWRNIGQIFIKLGFKVVACGNGYEDGEELKLLSYTRHEKDVKEDNAKTGIVKSSKKKAGMAFL